MSVWFALFMGLVQGLTEFLPVSSSGHLAIFQHFFGMEYDESSHMLFVVLMHLATLVSVVIFYWRDVRSLALEFAAMLTRGNRGKKSGDAAMPAPRRLLLLLIIATLPLAVFVLFSDVVEQLSDQPIFVGVALCCTGALLWLSAHVTRGKKDEKSATFLDALCVGLMQGIALIPGLSRSGTTISTGQFRGFDRKFAVRFSFLLSIPAVLGATVLEIVKAFDSEIDWGLLPMYLAGMLVAGIVGYLSLCLLRVLTEKGFTRFAVYCLCAGLITMAAGAIWG